MKRRRIITVVIGTAALALIIILAWPRQKEPIFQEKKLSEWMEACGWSVPKSDDDPSVAAANAIREIGTNATPWLLKWVSYETPQWKKTLQSATGHLPLVRQSRFLAQELWRKDRKAWQAIVGFELLGKKAAPVLPELIRMSQATNAPECAARAKYGVEYVTRF